MSQVLDSQLIGTVRNLGAVLGDTIRDQLGEQWLERIEAVRKDGRKAHQGDEDCAKRVKQLFTELKNDELLTVGRAFSQFLNLANIAEQEFNSNNDQDDPIDTLFSHLDQAGIQADTFEKALKHLNIELVLTAHPTEVTRRTLIHKHSELAKCLSKVHTSNINIAERDKIETRIAELISQAWHTEEIRTVRPTPVDEARWGFSVIENSLWEAVPEFIRELDKRFIDKFGLAIPLDVSPVKFGSWMGGDRDGNPFVTSKVTEQVLLLARKRAAKLFAKDIDILQTELSMSDCDDALRKQAGDVLEPYRAVLRPLLDQLVKTQEGIIEKLKGVPVDMTDWVDNKEQLLVPLMTCYHSLQACGMSVIAQGHLQNTIRRIHCFGVHLLKLDVRQDSERHADVFSELTRCLGLGDYGQWSEDDKQAFLLKELGSKRPLFPLKWKPSQDVQEVIDTFKVIAQNGKDGFGIYIISMASVPSDVLSVNLLLKELGVTWPMPVAPLFETLDDLTPRLVSLKSCSL